MALNRNVSVIIDNYNYGRFLRQAIDSALAQTHPHVEVIVVDDGSTDDSRAIIRSYGNRIVPVLKENGGQASAFNAGFAAAHGEIVAFLDADDYLHPEAMARIVSLWTPETSIVHHRLRKVTADGVPIGYEPAPAVPLDAGDVLSLQLRRGVYGAPPTSGLAYSRGVLEKMMPVPEEAYRYCGDTYLIFAAPFFGEVTVADGTLAFYRIHGENDSGAQGSRRDWTPRRLKVGRRFVELRHALIREFAARRGLPVPDSDPWETAQILFEELLLVRVLAERPNFPARAVLARKILARSVIRDPGALRSWRVATLALLVWLAPRTLLRFIYPQLFCAPAA